MRQIIRYAGRIALKAERQILIVFVCCIVLTVFLAVIIRYTPARLTMIGIGEVARVFLVYLTFLAAASIERHEGHFKFQVFGEVLSGKSKLLFYVFTNLIVLVTMGILFWSSLIYVGVVRGVVTEFMQWPKVYAVVPIIFGSFLLFAYSLTHFISRFWRLLKWS